MYQEYFCLSAMPFSIAPDPRFLHMSVRYREAIAHLLFGVQGEGGFVLLTGEIGTGKTTLCRCLLEQVPTLCDVAYILNPKMAAGELLASLCDEFHIALPAENTGIKQQVDALNTYLLRANAAGRRSVLIIDEAQNLQAEVLEQLRLLTNLETNTRKLLQIILIGQPELQDMLQRPEMRQVAQRIVANFHLCHLTRSEVGAYIKHRLRISGTLQPLFPDRLIGRVYTLTHGVPRLINLLCDRALLGTYIHGKQQVSREILEQSAREVFGIAGKTTRWWRLGWQLSLLGFVSAAFAGMNIAYPQWSAAWRKMPPPPLAASAPSPAPRPPSTPVTQVAVSAVADPAPPLPEAKVASTDVLAWPENIPRALSEKLAFHDLFRLYGVNYDVSSPSSPCKAASAARLRCLNGRGGVVDLLGFNQPALLLMDGDSKVPYHALLTGLNSQTATLQLAGKTLHIRLADLAPVWSGSFVLLWHAPAGLKEFISPGQRGPAVSWLRQSLSQLSGHKDTGSDRFDEELFQQLKAFQQAESILPDGVAGTQTLIRLSMRIDKNLPQLGRTSMASMENTNVLHP